MTDPRCAAISADIGEPEAGTATTAAAWVCLEQPGPWGRDALTQSHLDPVLGAELGRRAAATGVRVLLIRRPGRHADTHHDTPRRVFLAATTPGRSWLERADIAPEALLDLDFAALGAGRSTGFGVPVTGPLLLVCTNSRRDACCALRGRPLVEDLAAARPGSVWECTHTGGHRFAPTGVLLPTGYLYGRLDTAFAARLLDQAAAGHVVTERCRGRSTHTPHGQAAELAVRDRIGEHRDVLTVHHGDHPHGDRPDGDRSTTVRHGDGRSWRVTVDTRDLPAARPASCGATPTLDTQLVVTAVEDLVPVA
ncbi:sucrase ferredoxin [Saccharothrix isguenensis]